MPGGDRRDRRRRDLLRRRSRRLRAAPQRGVRADQGAGDPDDLRQLRLRDRPRLRRLRLRVRHPARPRARPAIGRMDARAHRPGVQGLHARAAVRSAFPARRSGRPPRARVAAQGQRVPVRGQAGQPVRAARRSRAGARCWCSGTRTSRGSASYGGVLFVNCGSVGKPKDGDPRAAFAILEADETGAVRASIERVPYDAETSHATSRRSDCQASTPTSSSGRPRCPTAPTNSPRLR